jgi:hypothetical protein
MSKENQRVARHSTGWLVRVHLRTEARLWLNLVQVRLMRSSSSYFEQTLKFIMGLGAI